MAQLRAFTVDDVTHATLTYNPSLDVESSIRVDGPAQARAIPIHLALYFFAGGYGVMIDGLRKKSKLAL